MNYKLGSLFDGSGGFPLSGALCGIEPVWAAEVEPYPIAVTRSRFPNMKHLGDISKVSGADIEPVDIITFGSPCQDLSVAGKRAGLKHEANGDEETTRSGLFMEAVRIIKEMRQATNGQYPRFALWENVPGAFSSNKGEDFRVVCEELIKIVEPAASMPGVPAKGWNYADYYHGDGWSLAYRVLDAQYWGVPQRRRRIYLVADFRGRCAKEILFEREGLRGYFATGRTPWQTTPADAQSSTGADDRAGDRTSEERGVGVGGLFAGGRTVAAGGLLNPASPGYPDGLLGGRGLDAVGIEALTNRGYPSGDKTETLRAESHGALPMVAYTLKIRGGVEVDSNGKSAGKGALIQTDLSATLGVSQDQYLFQPITDTHIIDNVAGQAEYAKASDVNGTLRAGAQGLVAYAIENHPADSRVNIDESGKVQTLTGRMGTGGGNVPMVMEPQAIYTHPQSDTWDFEKENKVQTLSAGMGMGGGNTPLVMEPYCKSARGKFKGDAETWKEGKVANTLNTFDQGETRANELVVEARPDASFIDVEMEVAVRKHEVNTALLCECLRDHKADSGFSNKEIAARLNRPVTEVEHWFRTDNCFAIPAPEVWPQLKNVLGITTTEFDQSIMEFEFKGGNYDMRNRIHTGDVSPTLTCGSGNALHLLPDDPVICLQGSMIGRADKNGPQGDGVNEDVAFTCNTIDRHAVAYAEPICVADHPTPKIDSKGVSFTINSRDYKAPLCAVYRQGDLIAEKKVRYLVRRLTPTECARLQGFADQWGCVEKKEALTDEEHHFWLDVRNTHAAINGRKVQDYTAKQMLTWYNKLWTDSSEYKMWGNGIALPTALYCLQGILDALNAGEDLDDWMN